MDEVEKARQDPNRAARMDKDLYTMAIDELDLANKEIDELKAEIVQLKKST